jgi:hypothetical protein
MAIHFPGLKNIDKPVVWVFPEVLICLDCGTAEFTMSEPELRKPARGDPLRQGDVERNLQRAVYGDLAAKS